MQAFASNHLVPLKSLPLLFFRWDVVWQLKVMVQLTKCFSGCTWGPRTPRSRSSTDVLSM